MFGLHGNMQEGYLSYGSLGAFVILALLRLAVGGSMEGR